MSYDKILSGAFEQGGVLALIAAGLVIAIVLGLVLVLKLTGFTAIGDKSKLVDNEKVDGVVKGISDIRSNLETLDKRMTHIESEIESRVTRDEIHELERAFLKLEGRLLVMEQIGNQTNHAVSRIEGYMFEYGVKAKGGA